MVGNQHRDRGKVHSRKTKEKRIQLGKKSVLVLIEREIGKRRLRGVVSAGKPVHNGCNQAEVCEPRKRTLPFGDFDGNRAKFIEMRALASWNYPGG